MKKARIIFTALTVLTVAGAALAFKVKDQGFLYIKNGLQCTRSTAVDVNPNGPFQALSATVIPNAGATTATAICTSTFKYNIE